MKSPHAYSRVAPSQTAHEQEALAFRLSSRSLRQATDPAARNRALGLNHDLWSILFRELNSSRCPLPEELKANCLHLATMSLDYSTMAVLKDLSLQVLIDINDAMAEGLEASGMLANEQAIAPLVNVEHKLFSRSLA